MATDELNRIDTGGRPRVVIVGGGFGGLYAARALRKVPVDVVLVDRTNHHLFQPLLYQVATAVLAPSDITAATRYLLRNHERTTVILGDVKEIDVARRVVIHDDDRRELPYDWLILAAGARHSYFGHDDWEPFAPGLKSIEDAMDIRRRFLLAFEHGERAAAEGADAATVREMMTFVVVGGGPTGVELAGILPAIARRAMRRDFRFIDTDQTRVLLLEAGPRILPAFPESLSAHAKRDLEDLGVEVRLGALVTKVEEGAVWVGDERIACATTLWGAGNAASPLAKSLGAPLDRAGRVVVEPDLSIPGHPEVFVVGDLAAATYGDPARPVPGVAPAAMQMGRAAARAIRATLRGEPRAPFRYLDKGNLATIGRHKAVGSFLDGRVKIGGWIAWWMWLFIHIMYLAGFRNRLSVLIEWGYAYFTQQRGARLITGSTRRPAAVEAPPGQASVPGW